MAFKSVKKEMDVDFKMTDFPDVASPNFDWPLTSPETSTSSTTSPVHSNQSLLFSDEDIPHLITDGTDEKRESDMGKIQDKEKGRQAFVIENNEIATEAGKESVSKISVTQTKVLTKATADVIRHREAPPLKRAESNGPRTSERQTSKKRFQVNTTEGKKTAKRPKLDRAWHTEERMTRPRESGRQRPGDEVNNHTRCISKRRSHEMLQDGLKGCDTNRPAGGGATCGAGVALETKRGTGVDKGGVQRLLKIHGNDGCTRWQEVLKKVVRMHLEVQLKGLDCELEDLRDRVNKLDFDQHRKMIKKLQMQICRLMRKIEMTLENNEKGWTTKKDKPPAEPSPLTATVSQGPVTTIHATNIIVSTSPALDCATTIQHPTAIPAKLTPAVTFSAVSAKQLCKPSSIPVVLTSSSLATPAITVTATPTATISSTTNPSLSASKASATLGKRTLKTYVESSKNPTASSTAMANKTALSVSPSLCTARSSSGGSFAPTRLCSTTTTNAVVNSSIFSLISTTDKKKHPLDAPLPAANQMCHRTKPFDSAASPVLLPTALHLGKASEISSSTSSVASTMSSSANRNTLKSSAPHFLGANPSYTASKGMEDTLNPKQVQVRMALPPDGGPIKKNRPPIARQSNVSSQLLMTKPLRSAVTMPLSNVPPSSIVLHRFPGSHFSELSPMQYISPELLAVHSNATHSAASTNYHYLLRQNRGHLVLVPVLTLCPIPPTSLAVSAVPPAESLSPSTAETSDTTPCTDPAPPAGSCLTLLHAASLMAQPKASAATSASLSTSTSTSGARFSRTAVSPVPITTVPLTSERLDGNIQADLTTSVATVQGQSQSSGLPLLPPSPRTDSILPQEAANTPFPQRPHLSLRLAHNLLDIILTWTVTEVDDSCAAVEHYQVYCYHRSLDSMSVSRLSMSQWVQILQVAPLSLPMACTVTHLIGGQRYHFAVRSVDIYRRYGPFSESQFIDYVSPSAFSDTIV